jgi:hypothetical protein
VDRRGCARLGSASALVPARQLPDLLVRLASRADPSLRMVVAELGNAYRAGAER